ncbi:alpha-glucuronidase A [Cladophialophora yegresii CBS 114405]|uniref:Alpha-glucuronidase n=1 Tax=Cladophialophora yegresii CBS 114405 TaxID=1182544 RepID=W9VXM2_9EURO|nr:alpha-glucuronidase A [Cladophialophora yegresii CBS 114405]EXJ57450.1 alpha-glucuronidase A [Cladophialophora yegresii CBS 114405]
MRSLLLLAAVGLAAAETGIDGWLRYAPVPNANASGLPINIVSLNATANGPVHAAASELQKGLSGIFNHSLNVIYPTSYQLSDTASSIVVGTVAEYANAFGAAPKTPQLENDGYFLNTTGSRVQILGRNERGALYGAFQYLSMLAQGNFSEVAYTSNPDAPIRWVNQWDNLDGSIERGYGGPSIFFSNGTVKINSLDRMTQYARLLASIGVNAIVVNNVNANASILTTQNVEGLGKIADTFRPYGVRVGISLNFASPTANLVYGNLSTFDPLDSEVIDWWQNVTDTLYARIPDMAGYLVKANSEGQPGPLTYNRTLAEGANLFANALEPHGGILVFRAFVYDSQHLNESVWTQDRANAAVEFFTGLDGKFAENALVQIKYGPIDFQVREPASPLFAYLRNTSTAIELEVTQEYLGQQNHLVYLPPLWKTVLDFDLRANHSKSLVRDIISGERFNRPMGGYAAVVNVGTNNTWLGSHLSMSNLYGYGRLAWDPTSDPQAILQDWIRLTFGLDPAVMRAITNMSMASWPAYENYTGNLGIQTLTDILYTHYGPNPQSQDNNPWGQWTRADHDSIGMDRTVANGTGFAGQYPDEVAAVYENISTTPDNLLLWFHHVNYTTRLHSGETVIQHFYNAHYAGAETAQTFPTQWEALQGKVDAQRYNETLFRLTYQAGHSIVWRDAINNFYHNLSGIADAQGRVGNHPHRIEAETMNLTNYERYTVSPFETASNVTAIVTSANATTGTASTRLTVQNGTYNVAVNYYDLYGGKAQYTLTIGGRQVGAWSGNNEDRLGNTPSIYLDGHSATRITFRNVTIRRGDVLEVTGKADGVEPAPLDYISILPLGVVD